MEKVSIQSFIIVFLICLLGFTSQIYADDTSKPKEPDFSSLKLTGDWYGERTKLAENGITLDIDMTQTFQGVLHGGKETNWKHGGSLDYWLKLDFQKMGLWEGAFVELRAETQFGEFINSDTGSILPVATDGVFPLADTHTTTLSSVVFTQFLSESFAVYFGKIDTFSGDNTFFAGDRGKENFMNLNFVANPVILTTVPYSTLGAGAVFFFPSATAENPATLNFSFLGPDGQPDTAGWDDDFESGEVYAVEYSQPTNFFDLPGKQVFGTTYSTKDFTALGQDSRRILGTLLGLDTLEKKEGSWCVYYNFSQYMFTEKQDPTQGIGLFGRFGLADDKTNVSERFYSIGLGGKGIIDGRDNDTFGVGYYHMDLSDKLGNIISDRFGDSDGIEIFYNIEVTPSVHITPDFQIINPSDENVNTAYVAGMRVRIDF